MKSLDQKRTEAAERQAYHNSLSLEAKLAVAESRRGESKREVTKLLKQLEKRNGQAQKAA
jgi:hypothetical protein